MKWWDQMPWSSFSECWVLSNLLSFTFIKKLFSSSLLSAIRVVSAYLRLLIFLPAILIPACASSSLAFCMMYSAHKVYKQGDNIQPWHTPFPILKLEKIFREQNNFPYFPSRTKKSEWNDVCGFLHPGSFVCIGDSPCLDIDSPRNPGIVGDCFLGSSSQKTHQ